MTATFLIVDVQTKLCVQDITTFIITGTENFSYGRYLFIIYCIKLLPGHGFDIISSSFHHSAMQDLIELTLASFSCTYLRFRHVVIINRR